MGGTAYIQEEPVGNRTSIFSSVARGERTALTGQGFDARLLLIRGEKASPQQKNFRAIGRLRFLRDASGKTAQDSTRQDNGTKVV